MEIAETYRMPASPERVWALLMDPEAIRTSIPGCQALTALGDDRYKATLSVSMAAITGTYEGTVAIVDKVPHSSYRMLVEGQGRPGFVKGDATIGLRPDGDGTLVDVHGKIQTGGLIARLGQRLIANVSKMMQDRFFANLQAQL
jgi:carbon monoxide dehydrogenase subunit G